MRAAIVGQDNIVINTAAVPNMQWVPPQAGAVLVEIASGQQCEPGWRYDANAGTFSPDASELSPAELDAYKDARCDAINARSDALIEEGFVLNGIRFALDQKATNRLLGLMILGTSAPFPIPWGNIDDSEFVTLSNAADVQAMFAAASHAEAVAGLSGQALKQAVRAATTRAQVDAVQDNR